MLMKTIYLYFPAQSNNDDRYGITGRVVILFEILIGVIVLLSKEQIGMPTVSTIAAL